VWNVFEAIPEAETVKSEIESNTNLNQVCIHVDNGTEPIFPEILTDLTQQFYSTKYFETGLGLAITKYILEVHSGELLMK
jgi:C4-dicarboxylate-specific signal transduction histidine kinase